MTVTRSPPAANARAMASPMPRFPPVTSTDAAGASGRSSGLRCAIGYQRVPATLARQPPQTAGPRLGSAPMRAIQVKQFGGPEVLELVDLPDPTPQGGCAAARRDRGRRQLRRHPPGGRRLPRAADAPVRPGRRGRRPSTRTAAGWSRWCPPAGTPSRRWPTRRPPSRCRTRSTTPPRSRFVLQGTTAWHLLRTSARIGAGRDRSSCTRRPAASAASPCSWPASWAPAASSRPPPRRTSATWPATSAPTSRSTRAPAPATRPTCATPWSRPTTASPVDIVLEMTGGRVFDASLRGAGAVRPAGHLRDGLAGAADAGRSRPR